VQLRLIVAVAVFPRMMVVFMLLLPWIWCLRDRRTMYVVSTRLSQKPNRVAESWKSWNPIVIPAVKPASVLRSMIAMIVFLLFGLVVFI